MLELINTADAKNSEIFTFVSNDRSHSTIFAEGIGSGEVVDLMFTLDNGTSWNSVFVNGTQVQLTPTNNVLFMNVRGKYRLEKAATAGVVQVAMVTENEIV